MHSRGVTVSVTGHEGGIGTHKKDTLSTSQIKFLKDLPDELEVVIAHREYADGVSMSEKAQEIFSIMNPDNARHAELRSANEEVCFMHLLNHLSASFASVL